MIIDTTDKAKRKKLRKLKKEQRKEQRNKKNWQKIFIWWPLKLDENTTIWWEYVIRRYVQDGRSNSIAFWGMCDFGWWEYKLLHSDKVYIVDEMWCPRREN